MEGYRQETYGDRIADTYDRLTATMPDPVDCVERLAELAGPGPALELGIGTGRIALPLAATGVEVHGIDASAAMVERLRAKPGGQAIPVTMGDFGDLPVDGRFPLVYVVFNTFFSLLTWPRAAPSWSRRSCPTRPCTPAGRACGPATWAWTWRGSTWRYTTRSPSGSTSRTCC